jgi:carboxylesterase type B
MMWWYPLLLLVVLKCVSSAQNVHVKTPSGEIEGSTLTSRLGKTIYSFRGIRYAKAPINELRFKVTKVPPLFLYKVIPHTLSTSRHTPTYSVINND